MSFKRVLPRDLFNEAKLLKCLGQVSLHARDDVVDLWIQHRLPTEGFMVEQDPSDGAISCSTLKFATMDGTPLKLFLPYNDRDPYPLHFVDDDADEPEQEVFNDDGSFTQEFLDHCERHNGKD